MLTDIKTILYATDLGQHTRPAFRMAVSLAEKFNANIIFLYVIEPLSSSAETMVNVYLPDTTIGELYRKSVDEIHTRVAERIKKFCDDEMDGRSYPQGDPQVHIVEGVPAPVIIKTAEKMSADLVVMGSHSHSGFEKLLIGSVASKVVSRCTKPVLLVPVEG
jgi:nucleotide-binding universal stress UspA family protein